MSALSQQKTQVQEDIGFTGFWIPRQIQQLGLTRTEQLILSIISGLDLDNHFFGSNKYLAEKLNLSESRVSFYITKLKRLNLIEELGYNGRNRIIGCLRDNWTTEQVKVSKNLLCVKTVSQTTRKQVVRLRENATPIHIYKNESLEESKASIKGENVHNLEIVHKSDPNPSLPDPLPDPIPIRSDSIPFPSEVSSIDLSSTETDELVEILELEPTYQSHFRPEVVTRWIKKYRTGVVLDNIKFFFKTLKSQKEPIKNPEAWMEKALKKDFARVETLCLENKRFAEKAKKHYNLTNLKISQRYCLDTEAGKDFYYNLPSDVFKQSLNYLLQ